MPPRLADDTLKYFSATFPILVPKLSSCPEFKLRAGKTAKFMIYNCQTYKGVKDPPVRATFSMTV